MVDTGFLTYLWSWFHSTLFQWYLRLGWRKNARRHWRCEKEASKRSPTLYTSMTISGFLFQRNFANVRNKFACKVEFWYKSIEFWKKSLRFFRKLKDFCWKSCWILTKRCHSAVKGIFRKKCYDLLTCYYLECAVYSEF